MSSRGLSFLVAAAAGLILPASAVAQTAPSPATETVVDLRVHGNHSIPDAEVLALAGVALDDVVTPDLIATVTNRLMESGRFATVDVRKRYRALTAIDRVALVIVVRERAGASIRNRVLRTAVRVLRQSMVLPLLRYEEGYGASYGAQISLLDVAGRGSRLSVPATWGGDRRAAVELDLPLPGRVVDRLTVTGSRGRRRHPALGLADDRTTVRVGVRRLLPRGFRLHAGAARDDVRFGGGRDRLTRMAAGVAYGSPAITSVARDEAAVEASVERIAIDGRAAPIVRSRIDARAYIGAVGQSVVAARLQYAGASARLPPYEQPLLGGGATLRGWPVGARMGDRLLAASIELRLPMTSPIVTGDAGVRLFYDRAAVWDAGARVGDADFLNGAGVGLFLAAPMVELHLDVAHDLIGAVRVHAGAGVRF